MLDQPHSAKGHTAHEIGIIVDLSGKPDLHHPFLGRVFDAVLGRVAEADCDLVILAGAIPQDRSRAPDLLERCRRHRIGGVILMEALLSFPEIQDLLRSEVPCIGIDLNLKGTRTGYVSSANWEGSTIAVGHLYENGRRRIAHISGTAYSFEGRERLWGFRQARLELGLPEAAEYVQSGDFTAESGRLAARSLLALPERPDAIFAAGDEMAIGAIEAIQAAGLRVPRDIAIVGYDDIAEAETVSPALTTIRQDPVALGRAAVEALLQLLEDPSAAPPQVQIPVELIVRESSGAAAAPA